MDIYSVFNFTLFLEPFFLVLGVLFGILLPGYLWTRLFLSRTSLNILEYILTSFALGITTIIFGLILMAKGGILFTSLHLFLALSLLLFAQIIILFFRKIPLCPVSWTPLFTSSRGQLLALTLLLFIFFIKIFYLSNTILPTATDMGHHLYWAKVASDTGKLPVYEKQEVTLENSDKYFLSDPEPISDFIIGEHLPLSYLHLLTGASYFGIFPLFFLFILNIFAVLANSTLFSFAGKKLQEKGLLSSFPKDVFFVFGLFLFGILFSLASPEMKFVSGGVVGNIFGNFFIPLILLFLLRAYEEKSSLFLSLVLLLFVTLAYIHHLSTFILLYIFSFTFFLLLIFWFKKIHKEISHWYQLFIKPLPLSILISILLFAFLITLPTYLENSAVGTAVGTPTKETRTGIGLSELTASSSPLLLGLSFFSLLFFLVHKKLRSSFPLLLFSAYGLVLLIMTMAPKLLFVNIPSARIAHYLSFPLTLLGGLGILFLVSLWKESLSSRKPLIFGGLLLFIFALIAPGLENNSRALPAAKAQALYVEETFEAARYLQKQSEASDLILKDHNFIEASDTWMKLFFDRGYNYPLSRSFFKRYEDNPNREQCTLAMIATPNTPFGKKCYEDLRVRYIIVNPLFDKAQFLKSPEFSLIYSSPHIAIFERHYE